MLFLVKYFTKRTQSPVSAEQAKNQAKYLIWGLCVFLISGFYVKLFRLVRVTAIQRKKNIVEN